MIFSKKKYKYLETSLIFTTYYNLMNKNNKLHIDYLNTLSIDNFLVFLDTPKTILRTYQVEGEIRKKTKHQLRSRSSSLPTFNTTISNNAMFLQNILDMIITKRRSDAIWRRKLSPPPPLLTDSLMKRNNISWVSLLLLTTSLLLLLAFCKPNLLPPV